MGSAIIHEAKVVTEGGRWSRRDNAEVERKPHSHIGHGPSRVTLTNFRCGSHPSLPLPRVIVFRFNSDISGPLLQWTTNRNMIPYSAYTLECHLIPLWLSRSTNTVLYLSIFTMMMYPMDARWYRIQSTYTLSSRDISASPKNLLRI
jgi:hypothetical protein